MIEYADEHLWLVSPYIKLNPMIQFKMNRLKENQKVSYCFW